MGSLREAFRLAIAPTNTQLDNPELNAIISAIDPLASLKQDQSLVVASNAVARGDIIQNDKYVESLTRQNIITDMALRLFL